MARNAGKVFEDDFKASIPEEVYFLRLHDSSIGFDIEHSTQRFSLKSPFDTILCYEGQMYAFELKSHRGKIISFHGSRAPIKRIQVVRLTEASAAGAIAGMILNFRDYEETYFIQADEFLHFMDTCGKKSVNLSDAREMGIRIPEQKKITHSSYDIKGILELKNK